VKFDPQRRYKENVMMIVLVIVVGLLVLMFSIVANQF
jgi:hypothetical protein